MKKFFYLLVGFCFISTTFTYAQRNEIILDGGTVTKHYGNITVTLASDENSPNSTNAGAVQLVGNAWGTAGFSDNVDVLKAQNIDLVNGTFTLDYKTSDVTGIYVLNLKEWDGAGNPDILKGVNNYVLTADGAWHTLTLRFNTIWEAIIGTTIAVSADIDPRVSFQFGATGGTLLLDNFVYNAPSGTTNINSISENSFDVYPNPVTNNDQINIVAKNDIQSVEIYTITGLMIPTTYSINGNRAVIPMSKVASGSYIVRLKTKNETLNSHFIVK